MGGRGTKLRSGWDRLRFGLCANLPMAGWMKHLRVSQAYVSSVLVIRHGIGCTPRGSCNNTRLLGGFLEGSLIIRAQEGCGGLGGEIPAAFPKARPIFQQPFSLPESAQTLAGMALCAAGNSGNHFPAASKFARKLFQQGISESQSLLEFSDLRVKEGRRHGEEGLKREQKGGG